MQRNQAEYERFKILNKIVKYPKALRVGRFRDIDEGTDLGRLLDALVENQKHTRLAAVPQTRCGHFLVVSRAPDGHLCFFVAILSRLPCLGVRTEKLMRSAARLPAYLIISLDRIIRLISSTRTELTHTVDAQVRSAVDIGRTVAFVAYSLF